MDKVTHSNAFNYCDEHQTDRHILHTDDLNVQFSNFNFYSEIYRRSWLAVKCRTG